MSKNLECLVSDTLNEAIKVRHLFLDRRQRGPIKSVLLAMVGWLVGRLVMQFSQKWL